MIDNIQTSLERISKEDAMSVAISLLYVLRKNPQFSTVSELVYLLTYEDFIKLIKYYGGMTIRIPTDKELDDMLKILLVYQYSEIEKMSWQETLKKVGIPQEDSISVRNKLNNLKQILASQEIGGRNYE